MNNILVLTPSSTAKGGVSNYYKILRKYLPENYIYFTIGARNAPNRSGPIRELSRLVTDYLRFILVLIFKRIQLVMTNSSLTSRSIKRDGLFIKIAQLFKIKVIVFYRGWELNYASKLHTNEFYKRTFLRADASIVLLSNAYKRLKELNYQGTIYNATTAIDNDSIKGIDSTFLSKKYPGVEKKIRFLFLARIEKAKGIYELIEIFEKLKEKYPDIELLIAGDGTEQENLVKYLDAKGVKDVQILGYVDGDAKKEVLKSSHIFIFPSYSEGMPTAVLEAMAFGLPVITTGVGGLVDFFQQGIHGYMINLSEHVEDDFVSSAEKLLNSKKHMEEISIYNHQYAKERFLASIGAAENMRICEEVMTNH